MGCNSSKSSTAVLNPLAQADPVAAAAAAKAEERPPPVQLDAFAGAPSAVQQDGDGAARVALDETSGMDAAGTPGLAALASSAQELPLATIGGGAGASDYVLYTFQLIDPNNSDIVWEGFHEIKKQGKDDVTYR